MMIMPGPAALRETHHSRELGRRIDKVVREYQRDYPDTSPSDVRTALLQMTPGDSPDVRRLKRVLAIAVGFLGVGVFSFMASTGGEGFDNDTMMWSLVAAVAAIGGIVIAFIRIARRG